MAKLKAPSEKEIDSQLIQDQRPDRLLQVGLIGLLFGPRQQAPSNIAAVVVIIAAVALGWISVSHTNDPELAARSPFLPIILGALGYLFGKGGK
jgi:hypothetical protein